MTLRLEDDEHEALRAFAERQRRSQHDVVRTALNQYLRRAERREALDHVLDEELPRYEDALRRLGE